MSVALYHRRGWVSYLPALWPLIAHLDCLDFNFQPDDPAYSLLVGDPLLPTQKARIETSRVVHATIDPSIAVDGAAKAEEERGEG